MRMPQSVSFNPENSMKNIAVVMFAASALLALAGGVNSEETKG